MLRVLALPLLLLCLTVAGCGQRVAVSAPDAPTDAAGVTAACAQVLATVVDDRGRVDFAHLAADERGLDRALAGIAQVPLPREPADRLAYLLNAYHLLAMKAVLVQGLPRSLESWFDRLAVYGRTTFTVAGEWRTLREIEDELIVPTSEPRVYAVLNGMIASCPRLRREAFTGEELDRQLEAAMREFLADARHVGHDPAGPYVVLSPILRRYRDAMGAGDNDAVPLSLLRRYGIDVPQGHAVRYAGWDWRVIYQAELRE